MLLSLSPPLDSTKTERDQGVLHDFPLLCGQLFPGSLLQNLPRGKGEEGEGGEKEETGLRVSRLFSFDVFRLLQLPPVMNSISYQTRSRVLSGEAAPFRKSNLTNDWLCLVPKGISIERSQKDLELVHECLMPLMRFSELSGHSYMCGWFELLHRGSQVPWVLHYQSQKSENCFVLGGGLS